MAENLIGGVGGLMMIIVLGALFFLPTIIAVRNPTGRFQGAAIIVNLLLGWTGIFWVIALILALQGPQQPVTVQSVALVPPTVADWYPDPYRRYEQRYYDGDKWTATVTSQGVVGTDPLQGAQ